MGVGLRISNLITCELCARYEGGVCSSHNEETEWLFRTRGKNSAQVCTEFITKRENISSEIRLEDVLRFMLAGCSEFTMLSCKTNTRFNYKIDQKQFDIENKQYVYWLSVEEKNGTYIYAGVLFFDSNDNQFKFGKGARGKVDKDDIRVKSILFVLNHLINNKFNMPLKVYHLGKCGRCGKKLSDEASVAIGLDKICSEKVQIPKLDIKQSVTKVSKHMDTADEIEDSRRAYEKYMSEYYANSWYNNIGDSRDYDEEEW